jgi:hypothetical protein
MQKLLQMFDNEPYESDNEYLDESDDDTQYKDIYYRRNDVHVIPLMPFCNHG